MEKPILIVIVVEQSYDEEVAAALEYAGIMAWTRTDGTGTGVWQELDRWVDPQKYIYNCIIESDMEDRVMAALMERAGFDRPGVGIAYSMPLKRVIGIP